MHARRRWPRAAILAVTALLTAPMSAVAAESPPDTRPPTIRAAWSTHGDQEDAELGRAVATAGDVNGDGYDEIIVGAWYYDHGQSDEGRALLYSGSPNGPSNVPSWAAEGDVRGAQFGNAVGTAGDVNGDGFDDLIVGAPRYRVGAEYPGRAFVYLGSETGLPDSPNWTADGILNTEQFGYSAATAGDVNGDGFDDVVIGAPYNDGFWQWGGRAAVYLGSATGLAQTPVWSVLGDGLLGYFGTFVSTAGDVNGDGFDDLLVGGPGYTDYSYAGRAFLYLGSPTGPATVPNWEVVGEHSGAELGSVATAGDVNGDGFDDVLVGAGAFSGGNTAEGKTYLYLGSAAGLSTAAAWTAQGNRDYAYFGYSLGTAGDLNGDGFDDVVIGAHGSRLGVDQFGIAGTYLGTPNGLSSRPLHTASGQGLSGDGWGAHLGFSVGTAGDVNGDGFDDIVVGAFGVDVGKIDEGAAFAFLGRP